MFSDPQTAKGGFRGGSTKKFAFKEINAIECIGDFIRNLEL